MKQPEEIKKGLAFCTDVENDSCLACPYEDDGCGTCTDNMEMDALAYIKQLEAKVPMWISVEDAQPKRFVSVLGFMPDAGNFPAVRECYRVNDQDYFFPALCELRTISHWMHMPKMNGNVIE